MVGGFLQDVKGSSKRVVCNIATQVQSVDKLISRFWELDNITDVHPLTQQEKYCEEHFKRTHRRDTDTQINKKFSIAECVYNFHEGIQGLRALADDLRKEGDDDSKKEIEQETNEIVEYEKKFVDINSQVEDLFKGTESLPTSALPAVALSVQPTVRASSNLPTIRLHQFSGNIEDWLPFWSSFKKVHENSGLTKEDKFQYLIQTIEPESRATALIRSYPPTAENYAKAINSLMERYGDTDLQIEVYIRQLLQP
ncbi:hypothetical protein M0804_013785 [Polistes exclamans]|nr:hypothetical protein M0804_013785 [Polistes exclamans]